MEALNSTFPVLVAFLTGLVFIHRIWVHSSLGKKSVPPKRTTYFDRCPSLPGGKAHVVSKESDLPEDWFVGTDVFELEKRAIFSKTWICLFHSSRFTKPGDYQSLEIAGFPIVLIMGRDRIIRAFHNVCRHRAYPITKKECGSSPVLGCRYHGWSYNSYGQLIKAPQFDHIPGFDKSQNGLFVVQSFTSPSGFVFVNLEATTDTHSLPESTPLDAFAARNRMISQSRWVRGQTIEGQFNWKIAVKLEHFMSDTRSEVDRLSLSYLEAIFRYTQQSSEDLSLFPTTFIYTIQGSRCWYLLNFFPMSAQKTAVRYDLYYPSSKDAEHSRVISDKIVDLLKNQIRQLEEVYMSLISGSGDGVALKSIIDRDDTDAQRRIVELLKAHARLEKAKGTDIYPAMREPRLDAKYEQAEKLCKDLDCHSDLNRTGLAW